MTLVDVVRAEFLKARNLDYIRAARALGVSTPVIMFKHALPNAILPMITLLGLVLPHVIGGSVIVERIFGIPGMGLLALEAIYSRDYPLVMGITTLVAVLTMLSVLLADLLQGLADPRVGAGGR